MKKIITSAGLVAFGAASVHAATGPALSPQETVKPWSVSASLRGFYDDNYTTLPSGGVPVVRPDGTIGVARPRSSFGIEVSPSAALNLQLDQTYIGLSYLYGMRYYENQDVVDHTHQANATLSHSFTERYKLDLSNNFVVAQEPDITVGATPIRVRGNNIRNDADASLSVDLTEQLSAVFGYGNRLVDYEEGGAGRFRALLNRMEHTVHHSTRWRLLESTIGILGYQFKRVDYTSNDRLSPFRPRGPFNHPSIRDRDSHFAFIGADHFFNPQLQASLRGGAELAIFNNRLGRSDQVSPYADGNVTWSYLPDSFVQVGVRHMRNPTDIAFSGGEATPTLDTEATTVYGSLSHRITARITGELLAQYQHSSFEGGAAHNQNEHFFLGGLNVAYEINRWLFADLGYNYDRLSSDLANRGYARNRVYLGVRATY